VIFAKNTRNYNSLHDVNFKQGLWFVRDNNEYQDDLLIAMIYSNYLL